MKLPTGKFSRLAMSLLTIPLFAGTVLIVSTTNSHALTLAEALGYAYMHNPDLNAERAATSASEETRKQAFSELYPKFSGSGTYGYNVNKSEPGDTEDGTSTQVGVSVSQWLYDGRIFSGLSQASSGVDIQQAALLVKEQEVLLSSATAYMDVIRDSAIVELRKSDLHFLEREVQAAMDRFSVGEGTRTDISQAEANMALAQSSLNLANAVLTSSRAVFFQIVGIEAENLRSDASIIKELPKSMNQALELAEKQHPLIRQTRHVVEAAEHAVNVARGNLLPSATLSGSYTRSFSPTGKSGMELDYSDNASVFARLSIPIFQGGSNYSKVRAARDGLRQAQLGADLVRNRVRSGVIANWGQYTAAVASISAREAGVEAAQLALSGVIQEQRVGQRTTQEVLNQQRSMVNSRVSLVEAQRNRIVAAFSLLSSVGGLNGETLELELPRDDSQ